MSGYSIFDGTLADMTFPQVEQAAARGAVVLLPTGVIEEHGPHLPLGTDAYGAYTLARLARDHLKRRRVEAVIAPPLFWGVNHVTSAFAGTFRTKPETAAALHTDVIDSLRTDGFNQIFLVNHQGDIAHNLMLLEVVTAQHLNGGGGVVLLEPDLVAVRLRAQATGPMLAELFEHTVAVVDISAVWNGLRLTGVFGVHAEEVETSMVARWFPGLVDMIAMQELEPTDLTEGDLAEWRKGGDHARRVTPLGYFGAPRPVAGLWRLYERVAAVMADAVAYRAARR